MLPSYAGTITYPPYSVLAGEEKQVDRDESSISPIMVSDEDQGDSELVAGICITLAEDDKSMTTPITTW